MYVLQGISRQITMGGLCSMSESLDRIASSLEKIATLIEERSIHITIDHGHIEHIDHLDHIDAIDHANIDEIHGDVITHPKNF
tara:strand:+ start:60 stop:308 length:249 start_codon:yes stop_codon:yes gene_type:complete